MKNSPLAKRIIVAASTFIALLIVTIALAESKTGGYRHVTIMDTWFLWVAFVVIQAWVQNRIWNEDDFGFNYFYSSVNRFKGMILFIILILFLGIALFIFSEQKTNLGNPPVDTTSTSNRGKPQFDPSKSFTPPSDAVEVKSTFTPPSDAILASDTKTTPTPAEILGTSSKIPSPSDILGADAKTVPTPAEILGSHTLPTLDELNRSTTSSLGSPKPTFDPNKPYQEVSESKSSLKYVFAVATSEDNFPYTTYLTPIYKVTDYSEHVKAELTEAILNFSPTMNKCNIEIHAFNGLPEASTSKEFYRQLPRVDISDLNHLDFNIYYQRY